MPAIQFSDNLPAEAVCLRMRVVMIHYHLREGGVTRVLQSLASGLRARGCEVVAASGEGNPDSHDVPTHVHPDLGYSLEMKSPEELESLAEWLDGLAGSSSEAVFHFHNPTLGKNPAVCALPEILLRRGRAVVAHVHDFAEDGRPDLLEEIARSGLGDRLYPIHPRLLWISLTPVCDAVLARAGVPSECRLTLPNPVEMPAWLDPGAGRDDSLVLYPGRGIARKNLAEFLLWSAIAPSGLRFATTLRPPVTSPEFVFHQRWKRLARDLGLPVDFAIGGRGPVAAPRAVLSTSVREGFGLAFAEPWLAGIAAGGRMPPHVSSQWQMSGIIFPAAYQRIGVSSHWLAGLRGVTERISNGWIDFGCLPPEDQELVLLTVAAKPGILDAAAMVECADGEMIPPQEWLRCFLTPCPAGILEENQRVVRTLYDPAALASRLDQAYARVVAAPATHPPEYADARAVLAAFSPPANECPSPPN